VTPLPDWLVERAALDEVAPASRDRLEQADPTELAERIEALRADNAAELATHPAHPAIAQIEARVATSRRRAAQRRYWMLGAITTAAALAVAIIVLRPATSTQGAIDDPEVTRVKGKTRLLAFRLVGDEVEKLDPDAVVHAGDLIQLRYKAGGQAYGLIASVDGAGAVTLHYPPTEDASTSLAPKTTALPNAYQLDDAPRFERFFFFTSDAPIDVAQTLALVRNFAQRSDSATATPDLPEGIRQWSLRLRKPDSTP